MTENIKNDSKFVNLSFVKSEIEKQISTISSITKLQKKDFDPKDGISILTLRNNALILYNACVAFISKQILTNQNIKDHPAIFESIKLRVLIERIDPLIKKLQPKISNLLKNSKFGPETKSLNAFNADSDALFLKPNPNNLLKDKSTIKKPQITKEQTTFNNDQDEKYKIRKTESVPYPFENEGKAKKQERNRKEREKKRLLQTGMIESLKEEIRSASGLPEKQSTKFKNMNRRKMKDINLIMEREEYELENFVRLPETKKDKIRKREIMKTIDMDIEAEIGNDSANFRRIDNLDNLNKRKRVKKKHKKSKKFKKH
ncbi:hypothetical protein MHBO_001697 [Bonamia ostreae]|uniref:Neuroguidin n=1 Tax=Bonamia ostreae TaxID=126728 RepID=A0ABV2AJW7_9EUKA